MRKIGSVTGLILLLIATSVYAVRYSYEYEQFPSRYEDTDFIYRDASELDDWIERGDAYVSASPVFSDGIRLECQGTKEKPAMAAAIYRFGVPSSDYMKIKLYYKDVSSDDEIAARVFIRTEDKQEREEKDVRTGDTFILRSNRFSETIHAATDRYVVNNVIEIHIVAQNQDVVDIKKIKLESVREKPELKIIERHYPDYWTEYPSYRYIYHYYYYGPYYWPQRYYTYIRWTWPEYHYWTMWRPWYRTYVRVYVRDPSWYRCYSVLYDDPPVIYEVYTRPMAYSYDDPPVRVRARRKRVSRSVVTRSRIRSRSYSRAPDWRKNPDKTRREYISHSNSNYSTRLKRRREKSRPEIETTIRRRSSLRNSKERGLLERVFGHFFGSRQQIKHRRNVPTRNSREFKTYQKRRRHSISDLKRVIRSPRKSESSRTRIKRRPTHYSHSQRSSRMRNSDSRRVIRKQRRDDNDDEERHRSYQRQKRRR